MIHLHQTRKSNCGQVCVAMIMSQVDPSKRVEEWLASVEHLMGKRGQTRIAELLLALRSYSYLGVTLTGHRRRQRGIRGIPELPVMERPGTGALMGMRYWDGRRHAGHWIVVWDGEVYDPSMDFAWEVANFEALMRQRRSGGSDERITSWHVFQIAGGAS